VTREEILARRAARLAARKPATFEEVVQDDVVEVQVGGERFAFSSREVREVVPCPPITPLPNLPLHHLGVAAVRGDIVGVVDLARQLEIGAGNKAFLVVVHHVRGPVGFLVDAVTGFRRVPSTGWTAAPSASTRPLRGVSADGLQLLDAARLSDPTAMGSPS
jgi:chemotaxis signal transduction protein